MSKGSQDQDLKIKVAVRMDKPMNMKHCGYTHHRSSLLPDNKRLISLQLHVRHGQKHLEEVEEAVLCAGPGVPVHLRHLQLQGEEVGAKRDVADGRVYGGLYRASRRSVSGTKISPW